MPEPTQGQGPQEAGNPAPANDQGSKVAGTFATDLAKSSGTEPAQQAPQTQDKQPESNQQGTPELPGWTAATTKVLKSDPRFTNYASKFKSLDDVVKSSFELEEKIGKMVALPDDKSTDEEKAAFWGKIGVPQTPADYKLEANPKLETDKKQVEEFQALAHKLHLTKDQAQAVYGLATDRALQELQNFRQRTEEAKQGVKTTLQREWGADFEKNQAVLSRGIRAYASPALLAEVDANGMGNSVEFLKLFHKLGQMTQEDSALGARSGGQTGSKDPASVLYPSK